VPGCYVWKMTELLNEIPDYIFSFDIFSPVSAVVWSQANDFVIIYFEGEKGTGYYFLIDILTP
jgi:hypothetical protein